MPLLKNKISALSSFRLLSDKTEDKKPLAKASKSWSDKQWKSFEKKKQGLLLPAHLIGDILQLAHWHFQPPQLQMIAKGNEFLTAELLSDRRLEVFARPEDVGRANEARALWWQAHADKNSSLSRPPRFLYDAVMSLYPEGRSRLDYNQFAYGFNDELSLIEPEKKRKNAERSWISRRTDSCHEDSYTTHLFFELAKAKHVKAMAKYEFPLNHPLVLDPLIEHVPDQLNCLGFPFVNETGIWGPMRYEDRALSASGMVRKNYNRTFEKTLVTILNDRRMGQSPQQAERNALASFGKIIGSISLSQQSLDEFTARNGVSAQDIAAGEAELYRNVPHRYLEQKIDTANYASARRKEIFFNNLVKDFASETDAESMGFWLQRAPEESISFERLLTLREQQWRQYFPLTSDQEYARQTQLSRPIWWVEHLLLQILPVFMEYADRRRARLANEAPRVD